MAEKAKEDHAVPAGEPNRAGSDPRPPKLPWSVFRDIAKLELSGNANREHQELLRRPENAVRWLRVLMVIHRSIVAQNAAANAYLKAHTSPNRRGPQWMKIRQTYETQRGRREWVLAQVADRVAEAKDIIIEQDAISAEALETLATQILVCDRQLAAGKVPEARNTLRRMMDCLGSIATLAAEPFTPNPLPKLDEQDDVEP
ncbi:MAG: hypothetical protein O2892_15355 [Actinomycetota bacterium]|nr:hypothetical protein [Actinomycetota bacterium]MDA2950393.1 hypothetical protein [Actinomycetota bacterium]